MSARTQPTRASERPTRSSGQVSKPCFSSRSIEFDELSSLLGCLAEFAAPDLPFPKLRYPSAGNLYPVQVYVYIKEGRVNGAAGGTYYYDRENHELVVLEAGAVLERAAYSPLARPLFDECALALHLIADSAAIIPIYGDRAREFCLLEAGYMGQLIQGVASDRSLVTTPHWNQDLSPLISPFHLRDGHFYALGFFLGPASGATDGAVDKAATDERIPVAVTYRAPGTLYPASPAERGFFFLSMADDPNYAFSTVPMLFELQGPLNATALQSAIGELLQRHEVLRSVYTRDGDEVMKRIEPWQPLSMNHIEAPTDALNDAREHILARIGDDVCRILDIESGMSFEAHLYHLRPEHHFLLLLMPHVMVDYASVDILASDLFELYDACALKRPSRLPPLPYQYADYMDYKRRTVVDSGWLARQEAHWLELLKGAIPVELPIDHPREPMYRRHARKGTRCFPGTDYPFCFNADLTGGLRELAESCQSSLFMAFLATFSALLHRQSGQTDIAIFSSYHHREMPGSEGLVGVFTSPQILRFDLSGDPAFQDHLMGVRATTLDAYSSPDFRAESNVPRGLFRINFNYYIDDSRVRSIETGLTATLMNARRHIGTMAELMPTLRLRPSGEIVGTILYCSELFEPETIDNMFQTWLDILMRVVAEPRVALSQLG